MEKKEKLEAYHNGILDLQIKYREDKESYILLLILYIYFVEWFSSPTPEIVYEKAPFIVEIEDKTKPKTVLKQIEKAIKGSGNLLKDLDILRSKNDEMIKYLNYIIPKKDLNYDDFKKNKQEKYYMKLLNEANIVEENNNISEHLNQVALGKTLKKWNTQRDDRVRKTTFHSNVDGNTTKIGTPFNVMGTLANYPCDSKLPQSERLNCRCYVTYY